jgi:hypothetical protein
MSELDGAMQEHMAYIVFEEQRPFTYKDFLHFDVGEKQYRMTHGTFRNKISNLIKREDVELAYNSVLGFYTLKGLKFGRKPMTSNPVGVSYSDPIVKLIYSLPMQKNALHDIHLRFSAKGLWSIISADSRYTVDPFSKDIRLKPHKIGNLNITMTIHNSDTGSVIVGCTYSPIAVDIPSIIRFSNALTRVEERLSRLVEECYKGKMIKGEGADALPSILEYHTWIVTMWHFGADACREYTGEKFCVTWEVGENALIRAYSKEMIAGRNKNKKNKLVRLERQEYPNKTFEEAIEEKLGGF